MAIRPKLDFFRISLKHKENREKTTFLDFVLSELGETRPLTEQEAMMALLKHFIKCLDSKDKARSESLGKEVKLIQDESNVYISLKPAQNTTGNTISGVINGGQFKGKRILSQQILQDGKSQEENSPLQNGDSVLNYYYLYLYLPLDSYQGCLIVHSNSITDSITSVLTDHFLIRTFRGENYYNPIIERFAPKCFQQHYKNEATIDSFSFRSENLSSTETGTIDSENFDFEVVVRPKNKNVLFSDANSLVQNVTKLLLGKKALNKFEQKKLVVNEKSSNTQKTFEWNAKEQEFAIVAYLSGKINMENDGTPNMSELKTYCQALFEEEILPDIRPDLSV